MARTDHHAAPARRRLLLVGDLDNLGDALLAQVEAEQLAAHAPPAAMVIAPYAPAPAAMDAHFAARGARVLAMRDRRAAFVAACFGAELYIGGGHAVREAVSLGWLLLVLLGSWAARLGGGRLSVVGAGASPVRDRRKRLLWRLILGGARAIRTRDAASAAVLTQMLPGLARRIQVTSDLAFMGRFDAAPAQHGPRAVCVVSPAVDRLEGRQTDEDRLLRLIGALHRQGVIGEVRLLAHDIRPAMDTALCGALAERIARELGLRATLLDGPLGSRLLDAYRGADLVITGRLHGLIVAAMLHRPVICFGDPTGKLRPFAQRFGFPTAGAGAGDEPPEAEAQRLADYLRGYDRDAARPVLERLRREAGMNFA